MSQPRDIGSIPDRSLPLEEGSGLDQNSPLHVVGQIARIINGSGDLTRMLQWTVQAVQRHFNFDFVGLLLPGERPGEMVYRAGTGHFGQSLVAGQVGTGAPPTEPFNQALTDRQWVRIEIGPLPPQNVAPGVCQELLLPLLHPNGLPCALLDVQLTRSEPPPAADLMLLTEIGYILAAAIRHAEQLEIKGVFELQQQRLLEFGIQINRVDSRQEILELACRTLQFTFPVTAVYAAEISDGSWTIFHSTCTERGQGISRPVDYPPWAQPLSRRQATPFERPLAAQALRYDLELPPLPGETIVPWSISGQVAGFFGLVQDFPAVQIGEINLHLLKLFSATVESALERIDLRQALDAAQAELSSLSGRFSPQESLSPETPALLDTNPDIRPDSTGETVTVVYPLVVDDREIGQVTIEQPHGRWGEAERRLAEFIIHSTALALEQNRQGDQHFSEVNSHQKLAVQLQTAAELASELGGVLDRQTLVQRTIDLMARRFSLSYVGLFLLDESGRDARLVAGTGPAGEAFLAQGHHLPVGGLSLIGNALANGRPQVYQDIREAEHWLPNLYLPETRSEAALLLRARGRLLGAVTVQSDKTETFHDSLVQVLQTMCDQIAIALDNSLLFAELDDRLSRSAQLNRAERRLIEAGTKEDIYRALVDFGVELDSYDEVRLLAPFSATTRPADLRSLRWLREAAADQDGPVEEPAVTPSPSVLRRREAAVYLDVPHNDLLDEETRLLLTQEQISTCTILPLYMGDEWFGSLMLNSRWERDEDPDDLTDLEGLCRQAAITLFNQELLRETAALYGLSQALSLAITREDVGRFTVEKIAEYTTIDQCRLYLLDRHEERIRLLAAYRPITPQHQIIPLTDDPLLAFFEHSREPFTISHSSEAGLAEIADIYLRPFRIRHALIIPIVSQQELIGFMILDSLHPLWTFGRAHRRFADMAVEQFTVTYENMVLYEEALARAGELVAINQIGARIASTLDIRQIASVLQTELHRLIPVEFIAIAAIKDERLTLLCSSDGEETAVLSLEPALLSSLGEIEVALLRPADPLFTPLVEIAAPRTFTPAVLIAAPFVQDRRPVGLLLLMSDRHNAFQDNQQQLIRAVANQAALGFSNADSLVQTEETVRELRTLFSVTQTMTASVSAQERIQNTMLPLREALAGADLAVVTLQENQDLAIVASAGEIPQLPPTFLDLPPVLQRLLLDRPQPCALHEGEPEESAPLQTLCPSASSILLLPLTLGRRTLGFLLAAHRQKVPFSPRDLRILQSICVSMGPTLESGRLFEQIQAANEKLQEMDRMKTLFLANMSHELRTPLNAIIGFSKLLLKGIDGALTTEQAEDLDQIHNAGQHLLNLINDILDLAKLDAGKMGLVFEEVDLRQMAESILATTRGLVREKELALVWDIPLDLPSIEADSVRLRQILLNLLSNAAKFTETGSISLTIKQVEDNPEFIEIAVTDTGVGIARKDFSRLFAKFEQLDAAPTRPMTGTGLGLPIVAELVELHNGRIWVESELGEGSRFALLLPIRQPAGSRAPQDPRTVVERPRNGKIRSLPSDSKSRDHNVAQDSRSP